MGHLGSSVGRASDSWFWLRSWSWGSWDRALHHALSWHRKTCLGFSLSPSLSASLLRVLSLKINKHLKNLTIKWIWGQIVGTDYKFWKRIRAMMAGVDQRRLHQGEAMWGDSQRINKRECGRNKGVFSSTHLRGHKHIWVNQWSCPFN